MITMFIILNRIRFNKIKYIINYYDILLLLSYLNIKCKIQLTIIIFIGDNNYCMHY